MGLTIQAALLRAAADLPEPFHETSLAEGAWRLAPTVVGAALRETLYPDLNKVRAALCGRTGPVKRGHLERVGTHLYRLTDEGRRTLGAEVLPDDPTDDARDEALLRLREAGDWLPLGLYPDTTAAAVGAALWRAYCQAVRWPAFEFEADGFAVRGRFVGTRMVGCERNPDGKQLVIRR